MISSLSRSLLHVYDNLSFAIYLKKAMFQWIVDVFLRVLFVIIWRFIVSIILAVWFGRQWTQASLIPNRIFVCIWSLTLALWNIFMLITCVFAAYFMGASQLMTGILATVFRFWNSSKRKPAFVRHYNRCWVQTEDVLGKIGDVFKFLPFNWKRY